VNRISTHQNRRGVTLVPTSRATLRVITHLRWVIPLALSVLGFGYTIWENLIVDGYPITGREPLIGFALLGVAGPYLAFLTLTWAARAAESFERAERERAALNQQLEARVAERTRELRAAKEELARKADALQQVLIEERRVEEKTRARIAHDLHDGVQQVIIGALFETQSIRDVLTRHPETVTARLATLQDLLRRIETEMRGAIYGLRPVALDAQGLVPALRECAANFSRVTQVQCDLQVEGTPRRLAPDTEVAAFRIVQEALNNVEAHARSVRVRVRFDPRELHVEIADDGIGFQIPDFGLGIDAPGSFAYAQQERSAIRNHFGLIGMQERAESVGGTLEVWSRVGEGTRVMVDLPDGVR
jgi:two-component system sensor histidine kinase DegS